MFRRFSLIGAIITFFSTSILFACPTMPDIINEFYLTTSSGQIIVHYSLMGWQNLQAKMEQEISQKTKIPVKSANLQTLSQSFLLPYAHLYLGNTEMHMTFLSGTLLSSSESATGDALYTPSPFMEMDFATNVPVIIDHPTEIRLTFQKEFFHDMTSLIHAYTFTDIQKNGEEGSFVIGQDGKEYDQYTLSGQTYAIRTDLQEGALTNTFTLFIDPNISSTSSPSTPSTSLMSVPTVYQKLSQSSVQYFSVGNYLQGFFQGKGGFWFQCFGLFVALFAGMMHGLLPGHSKSLVGTYVVSHKSVRYREIALLIGSVTFSHTIFIFILAILIISLQKGIGAITSYVVFVSAIGYIGFGIYFFLKGKRTLQKIQKTASLRALSLKLAIQKYKKNTTSHEILAEDHENCSCHEHHHPTKGTMKGTILSGLLAGCNPCIDALALFVFAISMGNGWYAFVVIIFFSLGLGCMLGILSIFVQYGQRLLSRKSKTFSEKFTAHVTMFSGVLIVCMGCSSIYFR